MANLWTFKTANDFWHQHHSDANEDVSDVLEAAEEFILDHTPASVQEADGIFDVLIDQAPGGRCDGRDLEALRRLQTYGLGTPNPVAATLGAGPAVDR